MINVDFSKYPIRIKGADKVIPKTNMEINPPMRLPVRAALPINATTKPIAQAGMTNPKTMPKEIAPLPLKYFARLISLLNIGRYMLMIKTIPRRM